MEINPFEAPSTHLYAMVLTVRPLRQGSLMAFSGEQVHAACLDWIRTADATAAELLHEGNKRRLFTCSSLLFPQAKTQRRDAERRNVHLMLWPSQTYQIRITLLHQAIFPLFHHSLTTARTNGTASPFLHLSKQQFLLERVDIDSDGSESWVGLSSWSEMIERAREQHMGRNAFLTIEFASLTTFKRGSINGQGFGNYFARLPLPHLVFPMLARRWHELSPPEVRDMIEQEKIEAYVQDEGIIIDDYELETHTITYTTHKQPGFVGKCTYILRDDGDEQEKREGTLTVRQQVMVLAMLAFYTGIGYKPAMGMGQARLIKMR